MTLVALCVAIAFCFTGGLLAMLGADRRRGAADGLCAHRLRRAAHADAGAAEPRALAELQPTPSSCIFVWPVLAMVVLGLADAIFGFRERYCASRPPPLPAA